jgi:lysine 2,3-aminomutase
MKYYVLSMKKQHVSNDTLPEVVSPYLRDLIEKTGGKHGPIGKQFIMQMEDHAWNTGSLDADPLEEDEHEVAPGLVYKYEGTIDKKGNVITYGRALWTITRFCSSYCRFCTRGREVGIPATKNLSHGSTLMQKPFLSDDDIEKTIAFFRNHKEINEIILSGGDPLVSPQSYLTKIITALSTLQKEGNLSIIRIGTRLPIANPLHIQQWHYDLIAKIRNPYLMVHINHPEELTKESIEVLNTFRKTCYATIMSQSVLLRGINDDPQTLKNLFVQLTINGIRPYYVFQCDPVPWAKEFIVSPKKAIALWQKLRPQLSGIAATARLVIDVPHGYGKIPVPEGDAWTIDYSNYTDFKHHTFPFDKK